MALSKLRALVVLAPPALMVLAVGCRAILGIEDRTFDPTLADSGPAELSCTNYCNLIMNRCTGQYLQYPDMNSCLGLCSAFQPGTLSDNSGDTLGCRLGVVTTIVELTDCPTAGPGGNMTCGDTLCETLCDQAAVVCPQDFDSIKDCKMACAALSTCPNPYSVSSQEPYPNDSSVACRLYHLSAASAGLPNDSGTLTASQTTHCPHVMGQGEYCAADAGACDAGD